MEPINEKDVTEEQCDWIPEKPSYEELESFNKQLQERLTDQIEKTKAFADKAYKAEKDLKSFKNKYHFLEETILDQLSSIRGTLMLADLTNTK